MKLMKLPEFQDKYFVEGSAPDIRTLKRYIDDGELPGKRIGATYYVDVDRLQPSDNPLVNKVLAA